MKKRLVCGMTAAAMAINMAASMPLNVFAAGGDTKTYKKDGYKITYKVGNEWDKHQNIQVKVSNTGEESILNWALKYDACGEIDGIWNAGIYSSDEEYTVVKNSGYNYEIEPGQSVTYGYTLVADEFAMPEDIELCSRRIDVKSGYEAELRIGSEWNDGFTGEIVVSNTSEEPIEAWTLSFDGNFDINNLWNGKLLSSESRSYEVANQLWTNPIKPGESVSFGFTAKKSADEKAEIENISLTAVVIGDSSLEKDTHFQDDPHTEDTDIDYELDSDGDGLPNYYEDEIGTDKNSEDTDGDGLNDGYELIYLGTDPLKQDTDGNGINDGNEDPDKDGLSNIKESELSTDPNSDDTDNDGLSDGDEVKKYGTDPLKYDTDGDGISDGDELSLGLDPMKNATDGTPDNERTFVQTVDTDAECLSEINDNDENPFDISLEVKAAGVAANNIYAHKSGYSNVIANTAIIGVAPEFEYTDGLPVEDVTVKFNVENSITKNTLGRYVNESDEFKGIKRLNIFMFIEDVNMLLPIETFHDEKNNIVYAKTDRMGTYCLVDMEIFLDNLSNELETVEVEKSSASSNDMFDNDGYLKYNVNKSTATSSPKASNKDDIDVVFLIDIRNSSDDFAKIQKAVIETSDAVFRRSPNARVKIIEMLSTKKDKDMDTYRQISRMYIPGLYISGKDLYSFYDLDEVYSALELVAEDCDTSKYKDCVLSDAIKSVYDNNIKYQRQTYVFCLTHPNNVYYAYCKKDTDNEKDPYSYLNGKNNSNLLNISTIFSQKLDDNQKGYAMDVSRYTNGICLNRYDNISSSMISHIYGDSYEKNVYHAIVATGYKGIKLETSLQDDYSFYNNNKTAHVKVTGMSRSDNDSLEDYEEIMFEFVDEKGIPHMVINDEDKNHVELYTYGEIINILYHARCSDKLFYVQKGLERYTKATDEEGAIVIGSLLDAPILPLKSDPTSIDGDHDGINDLIEKQAVSLGYNPLKEDIALINDDLINDSECINNPDKEYLKNLKDGTLKSELIYTHSCVNRPILDFERIGNSSVSFSIVPEENSDYVIDVGDMNVNIVVKSESSIGRKQSYLDEEMMYTPENKQGYGFILKEGIKYIITIYNVGFEEDNVNIKIYQDNWVYAPEGAVQTCQTFVAGDYRRYVYLTPTDIESIVEIIVSREEGFYQDFKMNDLHDINYAFKVLGLDQSSSDKFREKVGKEATIVGGILAFVPPNQWVTFIGETVALVGVGSLIDIDGEKTLKDFNFKLCLVYEDYRYSNYLMDYSVSNEFKPWDDSKLIYKYLFKHRTEIDKSVPLSIKGEYCDLI